MNNQKNYLEKLVFNYLRTEINDIFSKRKNRSERNENIFLLYKLSEEILTLENIGNRYNITRERVRQIVVKQSKRILAANRQKKNVFNTPIEIERVLLDIVQNENFILPLEEKDLYYLLVKYLENIASQKVFYFYLEKIFFQAGLTTDKFSLNNKKFLHELNLYKHNQKLAQKFQERKNKFNIKFQEFYEDIKFWNEKKTSFITQEFLDKKEGTSREINARDKIFRTKKINSGNFFSIKNQNIIFYESGLELIFYNLLENVDSIKKYYCQPFSIDYFYDEKWRKYYPDTLVELECGKLFVLEIKPVLMMGLSSNRAKWKAMADFCRKEGLGFLIADYRKSLQKTLKSESNIDFENEILELLKIKDLFWIEIRNLIRKYKIRPEAIVKLIYKYDLSFCDLPFSIRKIKN